MADWQSEQRARDKRLAVGSKFAAGKMVAPNGAMTRAKDDLHLIVPQRFFTHGQNAQGDRHVYAYRTRFIPDGLLGLFERTAWPMAVPGSAVRPASGGVRVDVGARMRGMWR